MTSISEEQYTSVVGSLSHVLLNLLPVTLTIGDQGREARKLGVTTIFRDKWASLYYDEEKAILVILTITLDDATNPKLSIEHPSVAQLEQLIEICAGSDDLMGYVPVLQAQRRKENAKKN